MVDDNRTNLFRTRSHTINGLFRLTLRSIRSRSNYTLARPTVCDQHGICVSGYGYRELATHLDLLHRLLCIRACNDTLPLNIGVPHISAGL